MAFKAALDAVDLLHAVGVEHHHQLPDDVVQPGAQAAAGDNRGGHLGGLEVELAPWASLKRSAAKGPRPIHILSFFLNFDGVLHSKDDMCAFN